ncbi:SAVED domain-containing protein [Sphingobium terrigena]|uniref:SAVED domain-containing protein n=1 Tax=Sphingobium terrigena TaxID=2304063 RepID=A0A418YQ64_9SPHN|nr:SAVED domain-containing protein [Sphingobium terrigena]RJG53609.1 SAVED domain-containing protein [Sphingobium terrigena]
MVDAITASWHGNNYQSRVFWQNALNLLDDTACVVEVTFEANGPKAFDDVVVKYDPPVPRSGPDRIHADYHQVKYHVDRGGHFGYQDFIDPAFIGAASFSLLERLRDAQATAPAPSLFTFLTTYRVLPTDPLATLISGNDHTLLLERLFDGTTDRSKMGKIRKCWREHLGLADDEALRMVLRGFRVIDGHRSLDELRSEINLKAKVVGLLTCNAADSDFRYDELARQLKSRRLNAFTREALLTLARDEGLLAEVRPADPYLPIAIRSFLGPASDLTGALPGNTLLLTDAFRQRYLEDSQSWQSDIRPRVEAFLAVAAKQSRKLCLTLDAHASIAFLAGSVLNVKSGVDVHLIQKGRVGARMWRADDGSTGARFAERMSPQGTGRDIAVLMSAAQDVEPQVRQYISSHALDIGTLLSFSFESGPGQQSITGGEHATALAEQVANAIRRSKVEDPNAIVHVFASVPNAMLFFFGQQHQAVAPCIIYEFDFDRRGNKSYQPSFLMD